MSALWLTRDGQPSQMQLVVHLDTAGYAPPLQSPRHAFDAADPRRQAHYLSRALAEMYRRLRCEETIDEQGFIQRAFDHWPVANRMIRPDPAWLTDEFTGLLTDEDARYALGLGCPALLEIVLLHRPESATPDALAAYMATSTDEGRQAGLALLARYRPDAEAPTHPDAEDTSNGRETRAVPSR